MRYFTSLCIDNVTKKTMVLSGASYNNSCFWLYGKGFKDPDKTTTDYKSNITTLIFTYPKKINFYYDENRGFLLSD